MEKKAFIFDAKYGLVGSLSKIEKIEGEGQFIQIYYYPLVEGFFEIFTNKEEKYPVPIPVTNLKNWTSPYQHIRGVQKQLYCITADGDQKADMFEFLFGETSEIMQELKSLREENESLKIQLVNEKTKTKELMKDVKKQIATEKEMRGNAGQGTDGLRDRFGRAIGPFGDFGGPPNNDFNDF